MHLVEGQQGGGGAGRTREEVASAEAQAPGIDPHLLDRALVGENAVAFQGPRYKLPVAGCVQLDGQARALGIEARRILFPGHGSSP